MSERVRSTEVLLNATASAIEQFVAVHCNLIQGREVF